MTHPVALQFQPLSLDGLALVPGRIALLAAGDTPATPAARRLDRLTRGSGNVIRQAEMLRELGARTQKRLALDHDGARLELPDAAAE